MDPLLRHFDLTEHPFSLSPDPRFFYVSPVHKGIIAKTDYVVRRRQGLTVVFGDLGLGKSTLARILMDRLRPDHQVTFLTNPNFTSEMHMVKAIGAEFGIGAKRSQHAQLSAIKAYLTDLYSKDQTPVLILDEAQLLKGQQFEVLRQLSNFETNDSKLLQINAGWTNGATKQAQAQEGPCLPRGSIQLSPAVCPSRTGRHGYIPTHCSRRK